MDRNLKVKRLPTTMHFVWKESLLFLNLPGTSIFGLDRGHFLSLSYWSNAWMILFSREDKKSRYTVRLWQKLDGPSYIFLP